jgi:hypothetical protein
VLQALGEDGKGVGRLPVDPKPGRGESKTRREQHLHFEAASGIEPLYRVLQSPDEDDEDPT